MNQDNYCSLEAAQRLVDAGIVLEADAVWVKWYYDSSTLTCREPFEWRLMHKSLVETGLESQSIPAPCFAELLQELKKDVIFYGSNLYFSYQLLEQGFYSNSVKFSDDLGRIESPSFISDNPADALAELLIWVKGQEEEK